MFNSKKIIICGGGNSIPFDNEKGIPTELKNVLENNYSMGNNWFFKYGTPKCTINTFCDWQFYKEEIEDIKKLPLMVGCWHDQLLNKVNGCYQDNTILLKFISKYHGKDAWNKGFYTSHMVSCFSLTLAIALGFKEIYLLGMDGKAINGKTHFYQDLIDVKANYRWTNQNNKSEKEAELKFNGVGSRFNKKKNKEIYASDDFNDLDKLNKIWYNVYTEEKGVNIYNVSVGSAINVFPKLFYQEFYEKIGQNKGDQDEFRTKIKEFIKTNKTDLVYTKMF